MTLYNLTCPICFHPSPSKVLQLKCPQCNQWSGALSHTRHLSSLYVHMSGKGECPPEFHKWAFISLISALLENRVYTELLLDQPLYPNLYVFLIGPSGLGKGNSIGGVCTLHRQLEEEGQIRIYRGDATKASLTDLLSQGEWSEQEGSHKDASARMWLIMDELKNDLGRYQLAQEFIQMMTAIFTESGGDRDSSTRTGGAQKIKGSCVTWLAGSTQDWLLKAIGRDAIQGGFVPRGLYVFQERTSRRILSPAYPFDREKVKEFILGELRRIRSLKGQMYLTPNAHIYLKDWYEGAPQEEDSVLAPMYSRDREKVLKLCMTLVACEGNEMLIRQSHLYEAITLMHSLQNSFPRLIKLSTQSKESINIDLIYETIKRKSNGGGWVENREVLQALARRNILTEHVKQAVENLEAMCKIEVEEGKRGGGRYKIPSSGEPL